jgi:hypothetical protein
MLEVIQCAILYMLEAVEGGLCLLEVLEVRVCKLRPLRVVSVCWMCWRCWG